MKDQRKIVAVGIGVPIILLLALLLWGTITSGGPGGRPGVNDTLGEAPVNIDPNTDFQIAALDGNILRLSDLKGKIVMIDFWSSWCAPCRAEAETLVEVYDTWAERGIEFIGVAIWDNEQDVHDFRQRFDIRYPIAIDHDGSVAVEFGVRGIPEKFFVNPKGEIVRKTIGPNNRRSLEDILADLSEQAFANAAN